MTITITWRWKGFTEKRSPVSADEALDALSSARGNPGVVVVITNEQGETLSLDDLEKASRASAPRAPDKA